VTPSQRARKPKRNPRKAPGEKYTTDSYREAIIYACRRAGVPEWHPNQLRHSAATVLRREFGLETAKAVLGHSTLATTQVYAEADLQKAMRAMERMG
jgi:integrase